MQVQARKFFKYGAFTLGALSLVSFGRFTAPVFAGDAVAPLIDKDFEQCLSRKLQSRFYNLIEASDEQKEKIQALLSSGQESSRPQREEFRSGLAELADMMSSDAADDKQIKEKVQKLRAMHEKIMDGRLDTALKVRSMLTVAQRKAVGERVSSLISGRYKYRGLLGS